MPEQGFQGFPTPVASGGGSLPTLLGHVSYAGASDAVYSTTSTVAVDIDATNLAVTFTAPASGTVLVRCSGTEAMSSGGNSGNWDIREGTTVVATALVMQTGSYTAQSYAFTISGLAAGSHTFKWGWHVSGNQQNMLHGPTYGAPTMEVWSA